MHAVQNTVAKSWLHGLPGRFGLRLNTSAFRAWWARSLASWLPDRMRVSLGLTHDRLLLQRESDGLRAVLESDLATRDLGRIPWPDEGIGDDPLAALPVSSLKDMPRWWLLPASAGLRRRMRLPAAAADRLRDVLAFELDRQTPFGPLQVHYDARVVGRRGDGRIDVDLVVVPCAALDAALAELGDLAATLRGVDMADAQGRPLQVNLLPEAQRRRRKDVWQRWNWTLTAVAVLALAAGLWQILANRADAADAFERATTQHVQQARQVAEQQRELVSTAEGLEFLQQARAGRPAMVEVLDDLSRRLPDSTFLERVSIENDRLLLVGLSSEASALIRQLKESKLWRAPALTGVLQPDPQTGGDRFMITAELAVTAPEPGEAADARPDH